MITRDIIQAVAPCPRGASAATWNAYATALTDPVTQERLAAAAVNTPMRLAHLLAQWAHECDGFTINFEDLRYRPERIVEKFGPGQHSAAIGRAEANRLAYDAKALGERCYGLGNPVKAAELGNTEPGDGYAFRGVSIQQITGRGDWERYAGRLGCRPQDLADPIWGIAAALLEWTAKNCNAPADRDDVTSVRRKINGGLNGLADVRVRLARAKRALAEANGVQIADPVLSLGASGATVQAMQQALTRAGYPVGTADGQFGTLTERAVAAFQVSHALPGTGRIDPTTRTAIEAAAANPPPPPATRRDLTEDDLAERGSRQIIEAQYGRSDGKTMTTVGGLVLTVVGMFRQIFDEIRRLISEVPPAAILLVIGAGLVWWGARTWARSNRQAAARLADARSGVHLAR